MMNFTLEFWLDLAPCPPPSSRELLYSTPYPTNLTTEELSKIAGRCKVPSREHLASRQSSEDSPEVWLILLLSLLAVIFVFIIFGIWYSYKHNKHKTRDTSLQHMPNCELLADKAQTTNSRGSDNLSYQMSKTDLQLSHN